MIDNVMVNIGAAFMIVGGAVLVSVVLGLAIYAVALVWVSAINKFRRRAKLVTRCKDCVHADSATFNKKGFLICPVSGMDIYPDSFCSYGERKRGENVGSN